MRARLVVFGDPGIEIALQLVQRPVDLLAKRHTVKLVEHGFVEALADSIGLWAFGLGARVIHILDREVELVFVPLRIAAIFAAAIGQHAHELDVMAIEERDHAVVEEIGGGDRRLAIVELGEGDLSVGVDEGLLVDPPNPFQVADIERVLGAAIARMLALELAMRLLLALFLHHFHFRRAALL